jgi:hypothetical protein
MLTSTCTQLKIWRSADSYARQRINFAKKMLRSISVLSLFLVIPAGVAVWPMSRQDAANRANAGQAKQKKLREIAMERDVEFETGDTSDLEYASLEGLKKESNAIVYGQIIDSKSFFDESGAPIEYGELITTEYTVDVLRIFKNTTLETMASPDKPFPAPLSTPLKIARNGGVVYVNGHRAAVKVKGYDALTPGNKYVFFLNWSPDCRAYTLTCCIFAAVLVNDDLSLTSHGSSKKFDTELRNMNLESFLEQIK